MSEQPLGQGEIELALSDLSGWDLKSNTIVREFEFPNHLSAVAAISTIALLQEKLNHHADITNTYNKLTVKTTTHSAGNKITKLDIELARKISEFFG